MTKEKTETNQEQEVDLVRQAFDAAVNAAGAEEDGIKLAMITAGATFKNVARLFNQYMIEAGLALSKEDRDEKIVEAIELLDLATSDGFGDAVQALLDSVDEMSERSGAALIRAYCKKNEIECYAKPKGEGNGRVGFRSTYYDFLVANPDCSTVEATAFINGEGEHAETSSNVKNSMGNLLSIHNLVTRIRTSEAAK